MVKSVLINGGQFMSKNLPKMFVKGDLLFSIVFSTVCSSCSVM